ncbi:MAG: Phosphoserine phosphatase RsbU [Firmicutes bacterium ADurb.Bin467]|nr:MAG: Phosphoserine phosphatase RsbU [Firmicutes bacterium ADurb.Bin467]
MAHIETLRKTTAEKERIERDLHVANKIQTSMLPRIFPPFPEIDVLDLYATMEPAREVGGDFYDFFLIDEHRLCFSIGDVSGKGVAAALFMVITRTILKNQALLGQPLPEIMSRTNAMLCSENEESMFATVFMGVLDIRTGDLDYVCAGHNPPLIARGTGPFTGLDVKTCWVVGGREEAEYPSLHTRLAPGDLLFLYTDGVTEAMNEKEELFGDRRMLDAANTAAKRDARSIIGTMRAALNGFVRGTPASDDVTMLALGLVRGKETRHS